jgi:hypothetical protein
MNALARRRFLQHLGVSAAALPFLTGLPSLGLGATGARKQRVIVMFSPNGTIPGAFWPTMTGADFQLPEILSPLAPFKDRTLVLKGVSNKVRGDGDSHMRGMSCLLTGIELFPGNIQGGSHTPAGWAKGISIDQELKTFFQSRPETRTRFGSLEFGIGVSDRADPWTRMSYAGPNQPVAPTDDPYQMHQKLYGQLRDKEALRSILDDVREDLRKVATKVSAEDRRLLDQHADFVRQMEKELASDDGRKYRATPPAFAADVANQNDNVPALSRMQVELMINSFVNDFARVATLQYTKSVGQARMSWLQISDNHHTLSHEPDGNKEAVNKLTRINQWFAGELAHLVKRLSETREPDGHGTLLDNTLIVWVNELGKGNSHTLDNIPLVLVGNGLGFKMGRALDLKGVAHNRLHLALAHAVGHQIKTFGNPQLCAGGALDLA